MIRRGSQILRRGWAINRIGCVLVAGAIRDSAANAATRQHGREERAPVVPPPAVIGLRCTSHFAEADNQRFIQKSALR